MTKTVLWWGRFDPDYSRNRILRKCFLSLGWEVRDFHPRVGPLAGLQAMLQGIEAPDLVWVPAFRQRDIKAATRWARSKGVPIIFDPMISAFDKQVFERQKFPATSRKAMKLLQWEKKRLHAADMVLADTRHHADFFVETFDLPAEATAVVALGAEEGIFKPAHLDVRPADAPLEALFFGSFIDLQAPAVIIEAAKLCTAPVRWTLLGEGPLKGPCMTQAAGHPAIFFEDYLPYAELPTRIHRADILLGIFGTTDKAARVIPNKVYQSLAAERPVVTRASGAYPEVDKAGGLIQIAPGSPEALAWTVSDLNEKRDELPKRARAARYYYDLHFGRKNVEEQLARALDRIMASG
ncbi:MAG: glycosyltransferase [Alphaproteobacteria bacterium]|nr:MAG: glycosyltransferase [Alphaproteobacteria bacterium]